MEGITWDADPFGCYPVHCFLARKHVNYFDCLRQAGFPNILNPFQLTQSTIPDEFLKKYLPDMVKGCTAQGIDNDLHTSPFNTVPFNTDV